MGKNSELIDVWVFVILLFTMTFAIAKLGLNIPVSAIPVFAGLLSFAFWRFVCKSPIPSLFSKVYPYKKLKFWAVLAAFLFFEYVLVWGLYTKQIKLNYDNFYSIIAIFIGTVLFYLSFIRMKVSLRYLFLAVFVPVLAMTSAIGLGKYFGLIEFFTPAQNIAKTVFLNIAFLTIFTMLYQLVCEEPVFRGFLTQRLMLRMGMTRTVLASSFIFAIWHGLLSFFINTNFAPVFFYIIEKFVIGCFLCLLFIKGKNLLIAAVSYGIITGLRVSLFSGRDYAGINQYFHIAGRTNEFKIVLLWLACILIGSVLVLITPQKKNTRIVLHKLPLRKS